MNSNDLDKNDAELNYLFWKDEILQVMYWLYGEELDKKVSGKQFEWLLNCPFYVLKSHFVKLVQEGLIQHTGEADHYELTHKGRKAAGQHFSTAFDGLQKAGHGECGPDCPFCYGDNGEKLDDCVHDCASSHQHHHS